MAFADELARFDAGLPIESARTPPASWYRDPAVYERERETVFRHNWLAVCRTGQVAGPGTFASGVVAGEPWVVTRDEQGTLRAFANVCRHHAALVAEGEGAARELVCPYHAWTYALDGSLVRAPRMDGARDFVRAELGLVPLRVAVWRGYVFACQSEPPAPLADALAPLDERLGADELVFAARRTYALACNWKVFVDNYLDGGYHVPHLHRALAADLEFGAYRTEVFDRVVVQSCGGRGERLEGAALYAWVHPNLMVNRYGPALDVNVVLPTGPESCEVVLDWYFAPDAEGAFVERAIAESEQVQREDVAISERVQAGLRSRAYDTGRYAPALEAGAHRFHRILAGELA